MRDMAASQEANVERSADIIFFPDFFAFLENVLDGVAGLTLGVTTENLEGPLQAPEPPASAPPLGEGRASARESLGRDETEYVLDVRNKGPRRLVPLMDQDVSKGRHMARGEERQQSFERT
jgi:hypothetical protein